MKTLVLPEHYNAIDPNHYEETLKALCLYVDKLGIDLVIDDLEDIEKRYSEQKNAD
jgi:hypothetical protein